MAGGYGALRPASRDDSGISTYRRSKSRDVSATRESGASLLSVIVLKRAYYTPKDEIAVFDSADLWILNIGSWVWKRWSDFITIRAYLDIPRK